MILLALAVASAEPTIEKLDVHKLQLPDAVFACNTPDHKVDFVLFRREGNDNYLGFVSNRKGSLFHAPVTAAWGVKLVSLTLEATGQRKGQHASVTLASGQGTATFVLTTDESISGTCKVVPIPLVKPSTNQ
jgi:hypothetical protein